MSINNTTSIIIIIKVIIMIMEMRVGLRVTGSYWVFKICQFLAIKGFVCEEEDFVCCILSWRSCSPLRNAQKKTKKKKNSVDSVTEHQLLNVMALKCKTQKKKNYLEIISTKQKHMIVLHKKSTKSQTKYTFRR